MFAEWRCQRRHAKFHSKARQLELLFSVYSKLCQPGSWNIIIKLLYLQHVTMSIINIMNISKIVNKPHHNWIIHFCWWLSRSLKIFDKYFFGRNVCDFAENAVDMSIRHNVCGCFWRVWRLAVLVAAHVLTSNPNYLRTITDHHHTSHIREFTLYYYYSYITYNLIYRTKWQI